MAVTKTLFTRQSSGLVREVSVANALFFNTAAFIGGTLGGAYGIAVLAGVPVVVLGIVTNWSYVAFIVGAFCVLLALIFASLTTVMPRSGGDYVFTSRIIPKVGPFLGWLESWMLAFASIALLQFETSLTLRGIQMEGKIIGIGTGNSFFTGADSWFTDGNTGDVTGIPGMIAGLAVLACRRLRRAAADTDVPQDRHVAHDLRHRRLDRDGRRRAPDVRRRHLCGEPPEVRGRRHRRPAGEGRERRRPHRNQLQLRARRRPRRGPSSSWRA